jgi:twitching motility protein PilT
MAHIDQLFQVLINAGASDLHLAEGQPPKIRRHGDVIPIRDEVLTADEMNYMLSEICTPKNWERFQKKGDLDFAYEMNENSRFRCNYFKQVHGLGAVFRLIPTRIATIDELGLPPVIKEFGHLRGGLVLVTGPTGSGKSTTLAALMDYINSNFARHIVTVEEPIEFVHSNKNSIITQREVPEHSANFPAGLKAALREDSDIVLVGEMRDLETISLALTAAETGLLVFGTLHTNNARKTVDRMIDVFPSDQQAQVRTMLAARRGGAVVAQAPRRRRAYCRERNSRRQQRGGGHYPRRCHAEAAGRHRGRQGAGYAVHGRCHLGPAPAGACVSPRGFHEGDRQEPIQSFPAGGGGSAGQLGRRSRLGDSPFVPCREDPGPIFVAIRACHAQRTFFP